MEKDAALLHGILFCKAEVGAARTWGDEKKVLTVEDAGPYRVGANMERRRKIKILQPYTATS